MNDVLNMRLMITAAVIIFCVLNVSVLFAAECDAYGNTTPGSSTAENLSGKIEASEVYLPAGEMTGINIYIEAGMDAYGKTGLYDNSGPEGAPGSLVAESSEQLLVDNSWNTFELLHLDLLGGDYWIAFTVNSPDVTVRYDEGYDGESSWQDHNYTEPMPLTFNAQGIDIKKWSVNAEICIENTITPTPNPDAASYTAVKNLCEVSENIQAPVVSMTEKVSYRFTAPYDMNVDQIHLQGISQGGDNYFTVSIQGDNSGLPDGDTITQSTAVLMNDYWNIFDVPETALLQGVVYHIVAQAETMGNGYNMIYTKPNHGIFPGMQNYDLNAETLLFDGSQWTPAEGMPVFFLSETGGMHYGNTYTNNFGSAKIHAGGTTDPGDDYIYAQRISGVEQTEKTVNSLRVLVKKTGSVTSSLRFRITEYPGELIHADGIFLNAADIDTAGYQWKNAVLPEILLETEKTYRIIFYCEGEETNDTDNYYTAAESSVYETTAEYNEQTAGGTQHTMSHSYGWGTWVEIEKKDLVYELYYDDMLTKTATPSITQTGTETATETITRTVTQTATETATQTITETATKTATQTITGTNTGTATETSTETITPTETATLTNTPQDTFTNTPSITPSTTETATSTITETASPTFSATATSTRTAAP
ncbi:MAG: hypothetical protein ACOC4H_01740, partial [bacterium]